MSTLRRKTAATDIPATSAGIEPHTVQEHAICVVVDANIARSEAVSLRRVLEFVADDRRHLLCPEIIWSIVINTSDDCVPPDTMSQKTVQAIVGRLLTDEEFRNRFLGEPVEALTAVRDQGFELTTGEVDALLRTDRGLWADAAARIDPQLQRASFRRV